MKVGIISDTHDRSAGIDAAFKVFKDYGVNTVLHCGDWTKTETVTYILDVAQHVGITVQGVLGNNDRDVTGFLRVAFEKACTLVEGVLRVEIDGRRIAVYHGHHKPTLKRLLLDTDDVLCLGHSHKPRYDRLDDKVILNPGSTALAIPRSKTWQASVAIYDSQSHEAEFVYFNPASGQ